MTRRGSYLARLLVALALIVQIIAPVRAGVAMIAAATDPLAGISVCGHVDLGLADDGSAPADACRLCDLVCHGNGFAATPPAPRITPIVFAALGHATDRTVAALVLGDTPRSQRARGPPTAA